MGGRSLVGECLIPLLSRSGWGITAFSRQPDESCHSDVEWRSLDDWPMRATKYCVCLTPIWVLIDYLDLLKKAGVRKIVVLSSTSLFSKQASCDKSEKNMAQRMMDSEKKLSFWAEENQVDWVVLRPTLIYGHGKDKNLSEVARLIHRFRFFPLLGKAQGLRQPVHAEDVAAACLAALETPEAKNRAYNISGAETLSYRDMVLRVFTALGRRPRLVPIPLAAFRIAVMCLRVFPRYRQWSAAMAERMNCDLVFSHDEATRDLDFSPRPFRLKKEDLPG